MKNSILGILLLIALLNNIYAQKNSGTVIGIVSDRSTGNPIENANVFIVNTSLGSSTDANGYYEIQKVPVGTHEIIITILGYEVNGAVVKVKNKVVKRKNFTLIPRIYELPSIEVVAEDMELWYQNLYLFKNLFFGQNSMAQDCKLTNDYVMRFKKKGDMFTAKAEAPIIVFNYALGYRVECVLIDFSYEESLGKVKWKIKSFYRNLLPENEEQKRTWEENRKKTFENSLERFLLWLRNDSHNEDDYKMAKYTKLPIHLLRPNEIIPTVTDSIMHVGIIPDEKILYFDNFLQVTLPESKLLSYLLLNYEEVIINEYGMTIEIQPFEIYGYWSTKGLATQLPLYYYLEAEQSTE